MAAGLLAVSSYTPARDRNGLLVPGARMDVFANKTTTRVTVYSSADLSTPLTNPVIANASGQFPAVWAEAGTIADPVLYTVAYSAANGSSIGNPSTFDDIQPSVSLDLISGATKLNKDGTDADTEILENLPYDAGGAGSVPYGLAAKVRQEMRSVLDYGADPTFGADSTTAFNNALASGAAVHVPRGAYRITNTINVPLGGSLFGDDHHRAGITPVGGTFPTFSLRDSYTSVKNLVIDSTSKEGGLDFEMNLQGVIVETHIESIITDRSHGFFSEAFTSGYHFRTYFRGVKNLRHRGPGYIFNKAFAFIYVDEHCAVDFPGSSSPNHIALQATGGTLGIAEGGLFIGLHVGGTAGVGGTTSDQKAFVISDMAEVHMLRARADSLGGEGLLIDDCENVKIDEFTAALCDGHQIRIKDSSYVQGSVIRARGRNSIAGAATCDGIRLEGANGLVTLNNVIADENTGHGFQHVAGSEIVVGNFISRGNTLRGIKTGTAGVVRFGNGGLNANVAGNYDLGGALHSIKDTYNAAGVDISQYGVGTG